MGGEVFKAINKDGTFKEIGNSSWKGMWPGEMEDAGNTWMIAGALIKKWIIGKVKEEDSSMSTSGGRNIRKVKFYIVGLSKTFSLDVDWFVLLCDSLLFLLSHRI